MWGDRARALQAWPVRGLVTALHRYPARPAAGEPGSSGKLTPCPLEEGGQDAQASSIPNEHLVMQSFHPTLISGFSPFLLLFRQESRPPV